MTKYQISPDVKSIKINKSHTLKVFPATHIKDAFYQKTIEELKVSLRPFNCSSTLKDEIDGNDCIAFEINWSDWIKTGSEDGQPWTEAWDAPNLIQRMATAGFIMSYFKQIPGTKKSWNNTKQVASKPASLGIGFIKKVPKSARI